MEMETGRDGWEMRLAVQKNILPRSQILTNGETPLERDGWWRGTDLNFNGKLVCHLNFGNLSNFEKVMYQSDLYWITTRRVFWGGIDRNIFFVLVVFICLLLCEAYC